MSRLGIVTSSAIALIAVTGLSNQAIAQSEFAMSKHVNQRQLVNKSKSAPATTPRPTTSQPTPNKPKSDPVMAELVHCATMVRRYGAVPSGCPPYRPLTWCRQRLVDY